ncbi:MAG TPA: YceI family protein [Granulicella sp.]
MKTTYSLLALAVAAGLGFAPGMHAQTTKWTIDSNHSQADFQIRHMGVSTVRGSISGVKGTVELDEKDITKSKVDATLAAGTVNTGNDRRDADLRSDNFFDVEKYPGISFTSTGLVKQGDKLKLTGNLTLGAVTKPITLDVDGPAPAQKNPQNGKTISGFSATGILKRSDFNFAPKPQYSAVLGDEVKFTIDVEIDKVEQ